MDKGDYEMIKFTIPLNPVSKKNSNEIVKHGNKRRIIASEAYRNYEKQAVLLIPWEAKQNIDYPVNIKALYFRKTRHKVDKTNLESALMDTLVTAGVLKDDSALNPEIVVTTDGSKVFYDKENPRTEVTITNASEKRSSYNTY